MTEIEAKAYEATLSMLRSQYPCRGVFTMQLAEIRTEHRSVVDENGLSGREVEW